MISAVEAVLAVQEKTWIPAELHGLSYFGENDWWQYMRSYHPHMCKQCDFYGSIIFFNGTDIRVTFPYMEIFDEDTIYVYVHPNCTCELKRVLGSVPK